MHDLGAAGNERNARRQQIRQRHARQRHRPGVLQGEIVFVGLAQIPVAGQAAGLEQFEAHARWIVKARVDRKVRLAADESHRRGQARGRIRIAVGGIRARVGGGERPAGRRREADPVGPGGEIRERIGPRHRGGGRGQQVGVSIVQPHHHVRQRRLAGILLPVEVGVHPRVVSDRGRLDEARIHRGLRLPARQFDRRREARDGIRIAVRRVGAHVGEGQRVARRRREADDVGSGKQIGERIRAGHGRRRGSDQVRRGVVQPHHHVRQPGLPAVLLAVAVRVHPREIAEAGRPNEARVDRGVFLPARQRPRRRAARGRRRVAVRGVVAHIRIREEIARRRGEADEIAPRSQVREAVGPGGRRRRHPDHVRRRIVQAHHHVRQSQFPGVLLPVAVEVFPRVIPEKRRPPETRVHRGVRLAADQRHDCRAAGARQRIAVRRVGAHVRGREEVARRRREAHEVRARHQIRERIRARHRRGRRPDHVGGRVVQPHHHVGQRRLAGILLPVAVHVLPRPIADGRPPVHAGVQRQVRLVVGQRDGRGLPRNQMGVAVDRRVGPDVARRELVVRRQKVLGEERARPVVLALPDPVGVRAASRHQIGRGVVDVDQHVGKAGFAGVLQAVRVQVVPRPVAERRIQRGIVEHHAAADQVQPAERGIGRRVGGEMDGVLHVDPQRAVRGRVVPHQRIAVDQVVGAQAQRLQVEIHARQRLRAHVGRRMLAVAAFRVAPHDDRVQREAHRAPVRFHHADRGPEGGGLAVAVQRRDRRDLEAVVAAAVHDDEAALVDAVVHRNAVREQVIDPLDVVVVSVAVADVGKHVVRAEVDGLAAQGLFHRGLVARLQEDVRPRKRGLLVQHDVQRPGGRGMGGAGDVDFRSQRRGVVGQPPDHDPRQIRDVRGSLVEPDVVDRPRRKSRAAAARNRIVGVRVDDRAVGDRNARDRLHGGRRAHGAPIQADRQQQAEGKPALDWIEGVGQHARDALER